MGWGYWRDRAGQAEGPGARVFYLGVCYVFCLGFFFFVLGSQLPRCFPIGIAKNRGAPAGLAWDSALNLVVPRSALCSFRGRACLTKPAGTSTTCPSTRKAARKPCWLWYRTTPPFLPPRSRLVLGVIARNSQVFSFLIMSRVKCPEQEKGHGRCQL